jgi:hypothetical protein
MAHRADVKEYNNDLMRPIIEEMIPAPTMLVKLVARGNGIDITSVIDILTSGGFLITMEDRAADDRFMPRQNDDIPIDGYMTVFSKEDGLMFTCSKPGNDRVTFIVKFIPKNERACFSVVYRSSDGSRYTVYTTDDYDGDIDHLKKLATIAVTLGIASGTSARIDRGLIAHKHEKDWTSTVSAIPA